MVRKKASRAIHLTDFLENWKCYKRRQRNRFYGIGVIVSDQPGGPYKDARSEPVFQMA